MREKVEGKMNEELKPCPFCGGVNLTADNVAKIEYHDTFHQDYERDSKCYEVCCNFNRGGCGASSGIRKSLDEAINAWNRRVNDE